MFKRFIGAAVLSTALFTASAMAKETVVWWDFLGGGDGVRMKKLIADFNDEMTARSRFEASTLDWGVPFYTKVQTSAAVGEAPDVMTYHASRIPLAVKQGILHEITPDDFKAMGLGEADFAKATWDAVTIDGKQYAVPLDTHPIVLYYNKDMLAKAGLLDANGKPKGLNGGENFKAAMTKAKGSGSQVSAWQRHCRRQLHVPHDLFADVSAGRRADDRRRVPRRRQCRKTAERARHAADWTKSGLQSTVYRLSGDCRLVHIRLCSHDDQWRLGSADDDRPAQEGKLFDWGAMELPVFFDKPCTYADSHSFAIPVNKGKEMSAEKRAAVLEVISWIDKHSLFWATAGHIPAYEPVTAVGRVQGDGTQRDLFAADGEHDLRSEIAAGGRCRADLRRDVDLLRADAERRNGPGRSCHEDQRRTEQSLMP